MILKVFSILNDSVVLPVLVCDYFRLTSVWGLERLLSFSSGAESGELYSVPPVISSLHVPNRFGRGEILNNTMSG